MLPNMKDKNEPMYMKFAQTIPNLLLIYSILSCANTHTHTQWRFHREFNDKTKRKKRLISWNPVFSHNTRISQHFAALHMNLNALWTYVTRDRFVFYSVHFNKLTDIFGLLFLGFLSWNRLRQMKLNAVKSSKWKCDQIFDVFKLYYNLHSQPRWISTRGYTAHYSFQNYSNCTCSVNVYQVRVNCFFYKCSFTKKYK